MRPRSNRFSMCCSSKSPGGSASGLFPFFNPFFYAFRLQMAIGPSVAATQGQGAASLSHGPPCPASLAEPGLSTGAGAGNGPAATARTPGLRRACRKPCTRRSGCGRTARHPGTAKHGPRQVRDPGPRRPSPWWPVRSPSALRPSPSCSPPSALPGPCFDGQGREALTALRRRSRTFSFVARS